MEFTKMIPTTFTTHDGVECESEDIMTSEVYDCLKNAVQSRLNNCYCDLMYANRTQKVIAIHETEGITFAIGKTRHFFSFKAEEAMQKFIQTSPKTGEALYEFLQQFDKLVIIQLVKALNAPTKLTYSQKEITISMCLELLAE